MANNRRLSDTPGSGASDGVKDPRLPVTRRGQQTRQKLLRVARKTFEKHGYHRTSVSKICRGAGVAMGTFYQYFDNKTHIFLFLARELGRGLQDRVEAALKDPGDVTLQLREVISTFAAFIEENRAFYQIFREIEFVDRGLTLDFYDSLAARLVAWLDSKIDKGAIRPVRTPVAALALIAVAYFCALRWIFWGEGRLPAAVAAEASRLLVEGISPQDPSPVGPIPSLSREQPPPEPSEPALTRGEATRRELLRAAERCFGERGFWATSVADLTRRAGVAQGAFYLYFGNKTEILTELVKEIHQRLRQALAAAIQPAAGRLEAEQLGFLAFFRFTSRHPGIYRIVREAEFVDASVARWYYESLAAAYRNRLERAMAASEIRPFDSECLAFCLLGIGHFLGLRWVAWSPQGEMPEPVFSAFIDLLFFGLRSR